MLKTIIKNIKRLVASVALVTLVLFGSLIQPSLHNAYLRYEVGESTVQVLLATGGGGTGFAVKADSGKEYIMTNRHVCAGQNYMHIKSDGGLSVWKKVIYIDNKHDLCLLEGDSRLSPLTLGSDPDKGSFFYIVGHPGLRQLTVSQGEYIGFYTIKMADSSVKIRSQCTGEIFETSDFEKVVFGIEFLCVKHYKSYSTTAVAYGGNSGSPVVNKWGNVVGVLFAGSTQQERDNFVVPLYEVKRVLSKF